MSAGAPEDIPRPSTANGPRTTDNPALCSPKLGTFVTHFPPLKLQRNRDSSTLDNTSTIVSTDSPTAYARNSSSPFVFPLPPTLGSRLPVPKSALHRMLKERKPGYAESYMSGKSTESLATTTSKASSQRTVPSRDPRGSWSDWVGTRGLDTRDLQAIPSKAFPLKVNPHSSGSFHLQGHMEESISPRSGTPVQQQLHTSQQVLPQIYFNERIWSKRENTNMQWSNNSIRSLRREASAESQRDKGRSSSLTLNSTHSSRPTSRDSSMEQQHRLTRLPIPVPRRNSSGQQLAFDSLYLTKSAPPSPGTFPGKLELPPPEFALDKNSFSLSRHRNSYSLGSGLDKSFADQAMDAIQESPDKSYIPSFPFTNSGTDVSTSSVSSGRRPSTDRNSSHSLNFSYPRNYARGSFDPQRRKSVSGGSHYHYDLGGDGQMDARGYTAHVGRSKSVNSVNYTAATLRKQHGGISPNIDVEDMEPIRISTHARPPITSRTSPQYSKIGPFRTPSLRSVERDTPGPLTRRASYSSVTGISPVADGHYSPPPFENATLPRARRHSGLGIDTQVGLDGSETAGPGSLPESPTAASFTESQSQYHVPLSAVQVEGKRVDDFDFMTTFDAATRPYTPDRFAVNAGMVSKSNIASRNPSKRSARSFGSLGAKLSKTSSFSTGRNVLSKAPSNTMKRKYSWEHSEGGMFTAEPISRPATSSGGSIFRSLRSRSRKKKKNDGFSVEMPPITTSFSGPARVITKQRSHTTSSLLHDASEAPGTLEKFGAIAKESKAKYRTVVNELKQMLTSRSKPHRKKAPAPKKIKAYMSGGRPDTVSGVENFGRKIGMGSKLGEWEKAGLQWIRGIKPAEDDKKEPKREQVLTGGDISQAVAEDAYLSAVDGTPAELKLPENVRRGINGVLQNPTQGISRGAEDSPLDRAKKRSNNVEGTSKMVPAVPPNPRKEKVEADSGEQARTLKTGLVAWVLGYYSTAKMFVSTNFQKRAP